VQLAQRVTISKQKYEKKNFEHVVKCQIPQGQGKQFKYGCTTIFKVLPTPVVVTDRTFGSAELLLCGSAQMTELFSAEHRTFFHITFNANGILSYFCFAKWPTCMWSSGKIANRMPTESKLERNYHINLKLFVSLLDLRLHT
jgi:hypothetical protein